MRLIDVDAAIGAIKDYGKNAIDTNRRTLDPVDDIVAVVGIVKNAPTVEMNQWTDADKQLPNTDELVLVIVNGKPHKNIELIDAYEFATYSSAEGWIVEAYPLWEKAHVSYWMPLPEPPKEADNDY